MNKKQVTFLWIIAAALGVAVAAVKSGQNKASAAVTKLARGDKLVADFPADQVAGVTVKGADGSVTVNKTDTGWVVAERDNFPADFQLLASTLRTLGEVKVSQGLEAGPTYDPRFGMDATAGDPADHGLRLTFKDAAGKDLESLALGKDTQSDAQANPMMMMQSAGGRFVRLGSDPEAVYVVGESFPRVTADPKDWLSDDFIKIEKIKSITLRAPNDPEFEPWTLARTAAVADFTLEGIGPGEEINTTSTNPLKNFFSFARFEDVVSAEEAAGQSDPTQARQAIITTFDGFTYTLDITPKKPETPVAEGAPAPPQNYFLTAKVTAELAKERPKPADETEEQAKTRDEEFQESLKGLEEKLAREQGFQGRTFEVTQWTVNSLLKTRADLAKPRTVPPGADTGTPTPNFKGIEATTPPVRFPPQGTPPTPAPPKPETPAPDTLKPDTPQPEAPPKPKLEGQPEPPKAPETPAAPETPEAPGTPEATESTEAPEAAQP